MKFGDCQIDHIIPKDITDDALLLLTEHFGLPDDFDLHAPQNLAPICVSCNGPGGKGNTTYDSPLYLTQLHKATRLRPAVIARAKAIGRSGKVAEHLLEVINTDLDEEDARREFLEHAPAVVQILSMLGDSLADHRSFSRLEIEVDRFGSEQGVIVSLDERGRTTAALLEEVCEADLGSALREPIVQLLRQVDTRVVDHFEHRDRDNPLSAGPPVRDWFVIELESLDFHRDGQQIEFTAGGVFEGSLSASLTRSNSAGEGLEDLQGDVVVTGTFSTSVFWDPASALSDLEAGDCVIDAWGVDDFALA
ncbi:HNH endonuclease signature motif containing protein [Kitasatospora sp. NPDC048545]|uniref:HNH endonuclease signature motif containing protein n=1 Tax=Kitasatospora sp. NPDC048545 TaxID=3157208 RepID=UPI0033EE68C8